MIIFTEIWGSIWGCEGKNEGFISKNVLGHSRIVLGLQWKESWDATGNFYKLFPYLSLMNACKILFIKNK